MDDELQRRVANSGPNIVDAVAPVTSQEAQRLLEKILMTPIDDTSFADTKVAHGRRPVRAKRSWQVAAGFGVAAIAGLGAFAIIGGPTEPESQTIAYSIGEFDPLTASCLPVADISLEPTAEGFAGTVTTIDSATVTIQVSKWYRGGPADTVVLTAPSPDAAALDGVSFVVGEDVLVTASNGVVGGCGTSGPATPELQAQFDRWFS
jgi:hypothetical protein